jgi:hypothetical protein
VTAGGQGRMVAIAWIDRAILVTMEHDRRHLSRPDIASSGHVAWLHPVA